MRIAGIIVIVGALLAAVALSLVGLPPVRGATRSLTPNVHVCDLQVNWPVAAPLGLALAAGAACLVYRHRHGRAG